MKFRIFIKSFFDRLSGMDLNSDHHEKIVFSDRLYLRLSNDEIALVSLAFDNGQVIGLSLDEAKQIFRSIKHACDLLQIEVIKTTGLSWKTDGRRRRWTDRVIIGFDGPMGYVREWVRRDKIIATVTEFNDRFGLYRGEVSRD